MFPCWKLIATYFVVIGFPSVWMRRCWFWCLYFETCTSHICQWYVIFCMDTNVLIQILFVCVLKSGMPFCVWMRIYMTTVSSIGNCSYLPVILFTPYGCGDVCVNFVFQKTACGILYRFFFSRWVQRCVTRCLLAENVLFLTLLWYFSSVWMWRCVLRVAYYFLSHTL